MLLTFWSPEEDGEDVDGDGDAVEHGQPCQSRLQRVVLESKTRAELYYKY